MTRFAWICSVAVFFTLIFAAQLSAQDEGAVEPKNEVERNADNDAGEPEGDAADQVDKPKVSPRAMRVRAKGEIAVYNSYLGTSGKENRNAYNELGMIGEFAAGVSVNKGEKMRAEVRVCYSCHGLDVEQAYFEYRPSSAIHLRVGRFLLPLGNTNASAYQGTMQTVSKPLTRAMGMMMRSREFNQGVLPAPASDNGISIGGSTDLEGIGSKLSYEVFAVRGFRSNGFDLNFISSRDYEDHNNEPGYGARIQIAGSGASLGFAYTGGTHDAGNGNNRYDIAVMDFRLSFNGVTIDGEVAGRRTEFDVPGEDGEDHFNKAGAWLQIAFDVTDQWKLIVAGDGLHIGNAFLGPGGPTPTGGAFTTDNSNQVWRGTLGLNYITEEGILFKLAGEYWAFSDYKDSFVFQFGAVYSF